MSEVSMVSASVSPTYLLYLNGKLQRIKLKTLQQYCVGRPPVISDKLAVLNPNYITLSELLLLAQEYHSPNITIFS